MDGIARRIDSPRAAIAAGIGMVHQHFMLVPTFTVRKRHAGGRRRAAQRRPRRRGRLDDRDYGLGAIDTLVSELSVGLQQRVEILKALVRGARILILDEPTGVLTPGDGPAVRDPGGLAG